MKKLIAALALCMAAGMAFADEPAADKKPSPDEMKQLMEMSFGSMVPIMGKMAEAVIDAELKIAEKPETAASLAVFKKNLYSALIKQGFTKKEAFEIMLNTPMPSGMPGTK